jgi:galactokinase/mevalonate kinase-like predicted kinase
LYGFETWAIGEQDKYRITSAEMKFMRITAKYKIYIERLKKTSEDV